jgi:sulfite reductase beta subunit-like hemoprotein
LRSRPDLVAAARDVQIKISGCPNGCGRHHIAGIGFQGSTRKLGDRVVPQYLVLVGGGLDGDEARFGKVAARIPARRVVTALERLIALYQADGAPGESAAAFFRRIGGDRAHAVLADLEQIGPEDALPADFVDLSETTEYVMDTKSGECAV